MPRLSGALPSLRSRAGLVTLVTVALTACASRDTTFPTPEPLLWSLSEQVPIATDTRDEFGATLLVYDRV